MANSTSSLHREFVYMDESRNVRILDRGLPDRLRITRYSCSDGDTTKTLRKNRNE